LTDAADKPSATAKLNVQDIAPVHASGDTDATNATINDGGTSATAADSSLVNTDGLARALGTFARDRDWAQFHSPKNLVMALTGEVGELNELFQWLTQEQSMAFANDPYRKQRVAEELADVLFYLVRMADVLGVDLNQAAARKLALNADKYPVDKARGNSKKYSDL